MIMWRSYYTVLKSRYILYVLPLHQKKKYILKKKNPSSLAL